MTTKNDETIATLNEEMEFAKTFGATLEDIAVATRTLALINSTCLRSKFSGPRPGILISAIIFLAIIKKYYNGADGPWEEHAKNYLEMVTKTLQSGEGKFLESLGEIL